MGNVQGPEKVNGPCVKTVHLGTMDRGFTVLNTEFKFCYEINNVL
jgi:hypothetical protein